MYYGWDTQCALLDLSETGARIGHEFPLTVPNVFKMQLPSGNTFDCVVRWRGDQCLGVEFIRG
jgi:hypothetical protein